MKIFYMFLMQILVEGGNYNVLLKGNCTQKWEFSSFRWTQRKYLEKIATDSSGASLTTILEII